jgi:hypothetical protein
MDFEKAKSDIQAISEIAKAVPEPFQLRCFELLFEACFGEKKPAHRSDEPAVQRPPVEELGCRLIKSKPQAYGSEFRESQIS